MAPRVAEEAVICEPVSALDSLLSGKITGYFRDSEAGKQLRRVDCPVNWAYLVEFPTKDNRVFLKKDQGTKNPDQGLEDWKT